MPDDMPVLIPPGPKMTLKHKAPEFAPPVDRLRAEAMKKPSRKERRRNRRNRRSHKGSSFFKGSMGNFLMAVIPLGALLYHQFAKLDILDIQQFHFIRAILVASMFLVLIIDGFIQDMMQGVISLFFPPYAWVYGLVFADNGPIRGLTVATLLFLGAEIWVTPHDSLVMKMHESVNGWIASGQNLLLEEKPDAGFTR